MKAITEDLQRLAAAHGGLLRPEDVVAAAKPKGAPLHKYFTWDDTEAARRYRLAQAAQLIRVAVIVVPSEPPRTTRCFVSLTTDRGPQGAYREVTAVLSEPAYRAQLLADAYRDLAALEKKYGALQELAEVFAALRVVTAETSVA